MHFGDKAQIISIQQEDAFNVLTNNCNVCHLRENPSKVFTMDNMNDYARRINRQVFVWKRMPKGKTVTLNDREKQTLKKWINKQIK